jgi:hypothetical protein
MLPQARAAGNGVLTLPIDGAALAAAACFARVNSESGGFTGCPAPAGKH